MNKELRRIPPQGNPVSANFEGLGGNPKAGHLRGLVLGLHDSPHRKWEPWTKGAKNQAEPKESGALLGRHFGVIQVRLAVERVTDLC